MSVLKGKVGPYELVWLSAPRGDSGSAYVRVDDGEAVEVRWRRDRDGIWIELPTGVFGFDIEAIRGDDGEYSYQLGRREGSEQYVDLSFVRAGLEKAVSAQGAKKKGIRIRAQMPGKIVRVLIQKGAEVAKEQPLVVMEAMKMENQILAPQSGTVVSVHVQEGQAIESGADLLVLE